MIICIPVYWMVAGGLELVYKSLYLLSWQVIDQNLNIDMFRQSIDDISDWIKGIRVDTVDAEVFRDKTIK